MGEIRGKNRLAKTEIVNAIITNSPAFFVPNRSGIF
jgi:hypothetical protein